ncbi:hypothetical protein BC829DRAFT_403091, partial [Chytridium lagenaria]
MIPEGGKGYLSVVLNPACPVALQKAYARFLTSALRIMKMDHPLAKIACEATALVLGRVNEDTLRCALLLLSPSLQTHPSLNTPFIRALTSLPDATRLTLLEITPPSSSTWSTTSSTHLLTQSLHLRASSTHPHIHWDVHHIHNHRQPRIVDTWWGTGVIMGLRDWFVYIPSFCLLNVFFF